MKKLDLSGQFFGHLEALGPAVGRGRVPRTMWVCKCACGVLKVVATESLRAGLTKSCGCLRASQIRSRSLRHGHKVNYSGSGEYRCWQHAKSRCNNAKDKKFGDYGGRGITMCPKWENDFGSFLEDMGPRPPDTSLDRIDNNGNYEPGNCRWATPKEQSLNRRVNVWLEFRGERMTLSQFAERLHVDPRKVHALFRYRHRSPEEIWQRLKSPFLSF